MAGREFVIDGGEPAGAGVLARGSQRALYALAIVVLFLAATYAALVLLARVTPALFPGRSLKNVGVVAVIDRVAPVAEPAATSSFKDPIHILVLGIDKRTNEGFQEDGLYLTDVVMVAALDPIAKKATLLSFPRDMYIEVHPKAGRPYEERLNMSYRAGVVEGGTRAAGIAQVKRDMRENFGIEVDYYVLVDFQGVEGLVDALGGVTVDVPPDLAVSDWWYSDDDRTHVQLSFPPGLNRLDGYHAVAFGRNRDGDSDLSRIKRQQLVLRAAIERTFSNGVIGRDPFELWDAYNRFAKTDISRGAMPGLADLARRTNGAMQMYSLGDPVADVPTMTDYITDYGEAVLRWDPENVQYWLSRAFPEARHTDAVVELRNAASDHEQGATRTTALGRYLVYSRGLLTVYYGEDATPQARTVVLLHRETRRAAAGEIATWLNLPADRIRLAMVPADDMSSPDITVVVGGDFVVPGGAE